MGSKLKTTPARLFEADENLDITRSVRLRDIVYTYEGYSYPDSLYKAINEHIDSNLDFDFEGEIITYLSGVEIEREFVLIPALLCGYNIITEEELIDMLDTDLGTSLGETYEH
jgi:hypothetical protein